jgi:hypothetical protein
MCIFAKLLSALFAAPDPQQALQAKIFTVLLQGVSLISNLGWRCEACAAD